MNNIIFLFETFNPNKRTTFFKHKNLKSFIFFSKGTLGLYVKAPGSLVLPGVDFFKHVLRSGFTPEPG